MSFARAWKNPLDPLQKYRSADFTASTNYGSHLEAHIVLVLLIDDTSRKKASWKSIMVQDRPFASHCASPERRLFKSTCLYDSVM